MEKTNQLNDISTFGYFAPPPNVHDDMILRLYDQVIGIRVV